MIATAKTPVRAFDGMEEVGNESNNRNCEAVFFFKFIFIFFLQGCLNKNVC